MSNFIIAAGHTASGNVGYGVVERLDESNCTRAIGALVAEYLQEKGHGVDLLRVDESNKYNCDDCYLIAIDSDDASVYNTKVIKGEKILLYRVKSKKAV